MAQLDKRRNDHTPCFLQTEELFKRPGTPDDNLDLCFPSVIRRYKRKKKKKKNNTNPFYFRVHPPECTQNNSFHVSLLFQKKKIEKIKIKKHERQPTKTPMS
eukprot:TRINITY_DN1698_c9_g1_i1.p3 TRINITY_DN1698_c9_g1~~TRINITY_DN1698_c9_g1_i1.p3  ORF type:complete len:102 (+),score=9.68 TRINITY_DN1698_c9_g1_i1:617-922(+)